MGSEAISRASGPTPFELLRQGREIVRHEANALLQLASELPVEFAQAVECLLQCDGYAVVTGMGKAGHIGQKLAATLASTGTPSFFLHPAEAIHGDLGRVQPADVVIALSHSGETEEMTRLIPSFHQTGVKLIAITGKPHSTLARAATLTLPLGSVKEACTLGLAPSTSTTLMLAMGDALALVTSALRGFRREDFARYHPGGSLGRKLSLVEEHMRPLDACRVAEDGLTVREVLVQVSRPGRRSGAILLVDGEGKLSGIFTDSDLSRLLEGRQDAALDSPVTDVMTRAATTVPLGMRFCDAVALMAEKKISELPVVDALGKPVGILDVTDIVSLVPPEDLQ